MVLVHMMVYMLIIYQAKCRLFAGTTTPRIMIKADTGKIGINTESPSEFLDVVGNIKCSGNFKGDGSQLTGMLVLGTTTCTAYDGGLGNQNATNVLTKQDILTFEKSIGNSLKLQENVVTDHDDILLMGNTDVIGVTYNELKHY